MYLKMFAVWGQGMMMILLILPVMVVLVVGAGLAAILCCTERSFREFSELGIEMAPAVDARWLTPFSDENGEREWEYLDRVSGDREVQGIGQDLGHEQVLRPL
jgi:hypothetical protein